MRASLRNHADTRAGHHRCVPGTGAAAGLRGCVRVHARLDPPADPRPPRPPLAVGYHRLLAHRSFKCPAWVEHTLCAVALCAGQHCPIMWVSPGTAGWAAAAGCSSAGCSRTLTPAPHTPTCRSPGTGDTTSMQTRTPTPTAQQPGGSGATWACGSAGMRRPSPQVNATYGPHPKDLRTPQDCAHQRGLQVSACAAAAASSARAHVSLCNVEWLWRSPPRACLLASRPAAAAQLTARPRARSVQCTHAFLLDRTTAWRCCCCPRTEA